MIVIEYMENGSLDAFLRVSIASEVHKLKAASPVSFLCWSVPESRQSAVGSRRRINLINLVLELLQCCDLHFPYGQ